MQKSNVKILSIEDVQVDPEFVQTIKKLYQISPYGSYYVISTTQVKQPTTNDELKLVNTLFQLANQGYSFFMLNIL